MKSPLSMEAKYYLVTTRSNYEKIFVIFEELKNLGFKHYVDDVHSHAKKQIEWLQQPAHSILGEYFSLKVIEPLREACLLNEKANFEVDRLKSFMEFWKDSMIRLHENGKFSFTDQKYYALKLLGEKLNDKTRLSGAARFHHIMIDEFQDINPLDLELINTLAKFHGADVIIVGDDDQAIFEWRGAANNFILNPSEYFGVDFATFTLNLNYRSKANIVEHTQKLIKFNKSRVDKNILATNQEKAIIEHKHFLSYNDFLDFIVEVAINAQQTGNPKELAILSRKKSQLIAPEIFLTANKIDFYAKEDLNVLLSKTFSALKNILFAVANKESRLTPNQAVASFMDCLDVVDIYPLHAGDRKKIEYAFDRPRTIMQCLEEFRYYTDTINRYSKNTTSLHYIESIAAVLNATSVSDALCLIEEHFEGMQKHYPKSQEDLFYKDPPFLHMKSFADHYGTDYDSFIDDIDNAIRKMDVAASHEEDGIDEDINQPIHLMTALRAKGKEFNTVIILDVVDGVWPDKHADTEYKIEGERRIFYVATTRAKKRLYFVTCTTEFCNKFVISPFISEMGFDFQL